MTPNPNIIQYIQQYRDIYTREAIDQQLLSTGYTPEEVAEAWLITEPDAVQTSVEIPSAPITPERWGQDYYKPEKPRSFLRSWMFWVVLVGFIVLAYALPPALAAVIPNNYEIGLATFGVLEIAAVVTAIILYRKNQPTAMGLLFGVLMTVVVIPCVTFTIALGTCLAILGGARL